MFYFDFSFQLTSSYIGTNTQLNGLSRMDNRNALVMIAGCIAFNSVMCLLGFPGGLANIGKTKRDWVFLNANLKALCISMTVFVVGMSAGPTFWKKIEKRARYAMLIAIAALAIAVHEIVLRIIGDDYWLRLFANWSCAVIVHFICGVIFFLRCGHWII